MYEYENFRRISYAGGAVFVPVCPNCGRFVKADDSVMANDWSGLAKQPNATCSKCGRVEMPFEGFFDLGETEPPDEGRCPICHNPNDHTHSFEG